MKHPQGRDHGAGLMGAVLVAVPVATAHAAPAVTALPTVSAALADDNTSVIVDVRGGPSR